MLRQILSSKVLRRNIILLLLLAVPVTNIVRAQILGTIVESFDNTVTAYNSMAFLFNIAWWWSPGGIPWFDPYYIYEADVCPNGNPVVNTARMSAVEGDVWMYGAANSKITSNGLSLAFLSVAYLSPFDDPRLTTLLDEYFVTFCWVGLDPGGGGGGGGGGDGGGETGGCDYCAANWEWTAACSGPYDHDYCGDL
jgi:hypothetical protein